MACRDNEPSGRSVSQPVSTSQRDRYDREWNGWKAAPGAFAGERRFEQVCAQVVRFHPTRMLDVGCGDGRLARVVKASCPGIVIHGCDLSPVALARSEGLDARYAIDLDSENLPEPDGSMDLVVASELIEHLVNPGHALAEMHRTLRHGGQVIVTVPNVAFWRYRWHALLGEVPSVTADARHLHSYNGRLLRDALAAAGFRVVMMTGLRARFEWIGKLSYRLLCDTLLAVAERP